MATVSESAQRIRPGVFAELQRRIDAHAATGGTLVPLHIGDTHLAPPPKALYSRALAPDPASDALYRYGATAGLAELRDAIAARAQTLLGIPNVDGGKHVHLGVGATHALFCAARAVLDAGDEVLVASPYWPLAVGIFHACSARPVEVPFTSRLYADPSLDAGALFAPALTTRTKALYLITPNNPDGKVLSRAQLESVASFAIENDLWVFADEVYAEVTFDAPHVSIASLPGMAARTITIQSFSKSHALAGARVGAVIAHESVIMAARRVGVHTVFNVPVAMQRAALGALAEGDAWMRAARDEYRVARDEAAGALAGSGLRFSLAEGGTYLFLDFSEVLGDRPLAVALERAIDHGVLLAPGDAFGQGFERSARLCYTAVPRPKLRDGIARLRAAIDSLTRA
ncbi:MAG: pyridoxal phosphate-dependent aminotransferase [Polyangiaceae bacterium]